MGAAPCKNPKSSEEADRKKEDSKKITIGVFGLNDAGKTSTVKAIEGAPTKDVYPTVSSETSTVPYPTTGKRDNKSQDRITIIDVSGNKKFRERSWSEFYDQIHGLIFVIDASEKYQMTENKNTLNDLLEDDDLRDKPILILANKQDRKGAINDEDQIKEKLDIENLKRKHKIDFCTAIPGNNKKGEDSIRKGFSWLIQTIESNYTELNSRVNHSKTTRSSRPIDRNPSIKNRQKNQKSDQSDSDDAIYAHKRAVSPPFNKKPTDYRSTSTAVKLPSLDLNKTKTKTSGHETYDESDDDRDRSRSRPNISRPNYDDDDRHQSNLTSTTGINKKKKLVGATNQTNNTLNKKSNENEPKPFRSTYEPYPDPPLWSSSTIKTTKLDDIKSKPYTTSSITNDATKRISPLVHNTKPYNSGSISKRDNLSDDDDFNGKQNLKSTPLSTTNKPSSTFKKTTSGIYGADDDDEINYMKKPTSKITKNLDSDDDDDKNKHNMSKTFQRPTTDRFNLNNEYRGTTSKPPPFPSITATRSKLDDDDFPSSSLSKPLNRSKFNNDYSSTLSKPVTRSRYDEDDDRPSSLSKPPTYSKYGDDDLPSSTSKFGTRSKYDTDHTSMSKPTTHSKYDDDDHLSPLPKPTTYSKYGDENRSSSPLRLASRLKQGDDDLPSSSTKLTGRSKYDDDDFPSTSKPITRSKYDTDDRPSSAIKPTIRSRYGNDDNRSSSPVKPASRSKYDDDDDDHFGSSSKPTSRTKYDDDDDDSPLKPSTYSKYNTKDRSPSPVKPTSRSKYDDDDDDSPIKPSTYSKYNDKDRSSPPLKSTTRSKYDDDDDDYGSSSRTKTRSNYNDSNRSSSPVKTTSRSKYDDDDDDDNFGSSSKPNARSKYDDDDDDSPLKSTARSKYDNKDRSSSPLKPTSRSKYDDDDDDYTGSGGARSRYGMNEFDSSKGGSNSGRALSASTNHY